MRARGAALVAVLVLTGTVVAGALSPAAAHASLVGSSPKDGASLTAAPTKITLRYDENVRDPSVVIVKGPDGKRVDTGGTTVLDNTASVKVSVREAGGYTVAYRVISADGHPVSGTTRFSFHGKDAVAASSSSSQPASGSGSGQDGPGGWLIGGGAVLVLLVAGGLLLGRRVGRTSEDGSR